MTTPRLPSDDLTAAMAARRELGPEYDDAFIETVVERIQESLGTRPAAGPAHRSRIGAVHGHGGGHGLALAVLSLLAAIPLSAIAVVNAGLPGLVVVMAGIVLLNVAYTCRSS
ncbi:hypothetical protein E1200_14725 [Actinomadura sp. GC306]|uniref:hypothetical protein n=1 Tax=Actinomadura sp. GC306 TaxID=2530367 RepID=UPI001049009A|nr:hypothetical protein [Actinomadura sp. GC306]TDC67498.1 hypothetical protein E1200_14725 [Actinomadura sp. GC306]